MTFFCKKPLFSLFLTLCLIIHVFTSENSFASHNLKSTQELEQLLKEKKELFSKNLAKQEKLLMEGIISRKELFRARQNVEKLSSLEALFKGNVQISGIQLIEREYSAFSQEQSKEEEARAFEFLEQGLISRNDYQKLLKEIYFKREVALFLKAYHILDYYYLQLKDLKLDYKNLFDLNYRISSDFGFRESPFHSELKEFHNGIDFACPSGTKIKAILPGKVIKVIKSSLSGGGKKVYLQHSPDLVTVYMHLSKIKVTPGQRVKAGKMIAFSGSSGSHLTGPHLHFELRYKQKPVNPRFYLTNF